MTDRDAFMRAICAEPGRDDLRLVYADFLEEVGEVERAEFIRVQCRVACLEAAGAGRMKSPLLDLEYVQLKRRERELLTSTPVRGGMTNNVLWLQTELQGLVWHGWEWEWRRGFVEEVRCSLAAWLEHGPAVVRCQPVRVVRVLDREPEAMTYPRGAVYAWLLDMGTRGDLGTWAIPFQIFYRLCGDVGNMRMTREYPTRVAALSALSAACVAWAKATAYAPTI